MYMYIHDVCMCVCLCIEYVCTCIVQVTYIVHCTCVSCRVTGGELFDEIVAREYYSETDARYCVDTPMYTYTVHETCTCILGINCERVSNGYI